MISVGLHSHFKVNLILAHVNTVAWLVTGELYSKCFLLSLIYIKEKRKFGETKWKDDLHTMLKKVWKSLYIYIETPLFAYLPQVSNVISKAWGGSRISIGGGANHLAERQHIIFTKISKKAVWNWEHFGPGAPGIPPGSPTQGVTW